MVAHTADSTNKYQANFEDLDMHVKMTYMCVLLGRFAQGNVNLVLVTHGLALRIILMRWFHWTVDQFLTVYNPQNAEPIVLERIPQSTTGGTSWAHTKMLYRMSDDSLKLLNGCSPEMVKPSIQT